MKISKMFHWLYAFLMFLPIFFVLGKGLYVTFNQNAKDSYYGETINDVDYLNVPYGELIFNENYTYVDTRKSYFQSSTSSMIYVSDLVNNNMNIGTSGNPVDFSLCNYISFNMYNSETLYYMQIRFFKDLDSTNFYFINTFNRDISFSFTYLSTYSSGTISSLLNPFITKQYNNYSYLDNAISYGMYELNESVLFAWAKDSFLSVPITYISNLFNMPTNSPIITSLSYWLNISIIWLTFDVIMYVPLLVHRWLDKGVRE